MSVPSSDQFYSTTWDLGAMVGNIPAITEKFKYIRFKKLVVTYYIPNVTLTSTEKWPKLYWRIPESYDAITVSEQNFKDCSDVQSSYLVPWRPIRITVRNPVIWPLVHTTSTIIKGQRGYWYNSEDLIGLTYSHRVVSMYIENYNTSMSPGQIYYDMKCHYEYKGQSFVNI